MGPDKLHKKMHKLEKKMLKRMPPRFSEMEDDMLLMAVKNFPALFDWKHEDFKDSKTKSDIWDNIALLTGRDVETCRRRWRDIRDNYFKIKRKHKMGKCKWSLASKLRFLEGVEPERRFVMVVSPGNDSTTKEEGYKSGRKSAYPIVIHIPKDEATSVAQEGTVGSSSDVPRSNSSMTSTSSSGNPDIPKEQDKMSPTSNYFDIRREAFKVTIQHLNEKCSSPRPSILKKNPFQVDDIDLFMMSICKQVKKMDPAQVAQAKLKILSAINEVLLEQVQIRDSPNISMETDQA